MIWIAYATVQTVMLTDSGKNCGNRLKYVVKFSLICSISIKSVSTLLKRVPVFPRCSAALPSAEYFASSRELRNGSKMRA